MIKKSIFIIICILIMGSLFGCGNTEPSEITTIYSNSTTAFTEFDDYLMKTIGISATPAHIIIKNEKVTNYIDYVITPELFKNVVKDNKCNIDLYQSNISDDIVMKDFDLVIVKREGCGPCKEQEQYEQDILNQFKGKKVLIYYILTENPCLGGCE